MLDRWDKALSPTLLLLLLAVFISHITAESLKCPKLTECSPRNVPCKGNSDCESGEVCCGSPCGNICTQQLHSGCEQVERAARRRAKSLGVEGKGVRIPRCSKGGSFEPIQCDNEIVSSCWCVDEQGFELAGTRAPAAGLVNCTAPKDCAAHTCRMLCPHGFALAEDGCPLCKCRDPCDDVKCPDSLSCHLDDLPCSDPPCPPIPSCKRGRSLENYCPIGDPLKIIETGLPFLCGNEPSKPACPPMFQCLVKNGHDYGVCCPASLNIQKAGQCPASQADKEDECGISCQHDLECHSIQKCCESSSCGKHCVHPQNLTECIHQRKLADLLAINERAGKGYVPQCTERGEFEPRQCSRNGLVCWCVDRAGYKLKGSMGAAANVSCTLTEARDRTNARSLDSNTLNCERLECAAVCEYGFKMDEDGCQTCNCDDPCEGFSCGLEEECIAVKDSSCTDFLCATVPVCRPKVLYNNPCEVGTPLTDTITESPITCSLKVGDTDKCPPLYTCTKVFASKHSVCCPTPNVTEDKTTPSTLDITPDPENLAKDPERPLSMCEYLRDFSDSMEGTQEGMRMALPTPKCNDQTGSFLAQQCDKTDCWCVDHFGTEIPRTRAQSKAAEDCNDLRNNLDCLDLTCRMGCEYGFELDEETRCPKCQCKDPCSAVSCAKNEQCQLVEVSCKDYYCPPVPACLPRKTGQCPYLVPASSTSCDFECNSDLACNGTTRCCSNGCGTQCTEPLHLTACQHQRAVAQHQSHESGIPAGKVYMAQCTEDGSFEPLQCNPGTQECWCVDFRGFEISSTRTPSSKKLDCNAPPKSDCPLYKCYEDCEHGFEMDKNGCRTCKCIEPCDKITCKGEGETCRLVQVECENMPCPPVPMCLPKKDNPCQHGSPLMYGDDQVSCGPDYDSCPSSHKCQLSPLGEYAVCCPKPRDVCFEPKDEGSCPDKDIARNLTRWAFNPRSNTCESFSYSGCQGNHNNFHTEQLCNQVCPVLSQCERLREKNQKVSERYNKPTFMPRCEPETGAWKAVQCLESVPVCWCVSPQGEPLKGTLTRGAEPECNFRKARRKNTDISDDTDLVFEEIIMQIGSLEEPDIESTGSNIVYWEQPPKTRCQALKAQCDSQGQFSPKQCEGNTCWCVDEAGNQLPLTSAFKDGEQICLPTPIDTVEVTIGFRGEFDAQTAIAATKQMRTIIANMKGTIVKDELTTELTPDALYIRFSLEGNNKVDVAFRLEEMVTDQSMSNLLPDITRSQFVHRLEDGESTKRVIPLEHREIVAQSPVSMVAPYHTALIVIAAGSAFIISILTLLVLLYRRKASGMNSGDGAKNIDNNKEHFLVYSQPVYIELPKEKTENCSSSPGMKTDHNALAV